MAQAPNTIHYLDYRSFLQDLVEWLRSENHSLSMRKIAEIAGASSPNWVQQVISRRIKAKPEALERIADYAKLSQNSKKQFLLLAAFDHARTLEEKEALLQKILRERRNVSLYTLENDQYQFFSSWYIPVIRELCTHPDFDGTEEWITQRIQPSIRPSNVRRAMRILSKLHLIKKDEISGRWVMNSTTVTTPSEVTSVAVKRYHQKIADLGKLAISTLPREERDFRSVTLGLSEKEYQKIKKRLEEFWYELMDLASECKKTEQVYQYTMQLFPVSSNIDSPCPKSKK